MAVSAEEGRRDRRNPTKSFLQSRIAGKLVNVFRPDDGRVGRLAKRQRGRNRCEATVRFQQQGTDCKFGLTSQSKLQVVLDRSPEQWIKNLPVYLPSRELLALFPGFVSLYENHNVEFEETWRDTCQLLGAPTLRGPRKGQEASVLPQPPLKQIGRVSLNRNGRFYMQQVDGTEMEMPLVAEGWRKLAMLSRLVASGSISRGCVLFWDQPEANLGPKLIRRIAETILRLCENGVQIICTTHSLFLLRELEILLRGELSRVEQRYFALKRGDEGVDVCQSDDVSEVDPLVLLDEELRQSDRYVEEILP